MAYPLHPYLKSARKRLTMHPIYHLFDLGVINTLCGRMGEAPQRGTTVYGRLFEQFVILELKRLLSYREKDWPVHYWRTAHGAEVDIVLETERELWAVEIKSSQTIRASELRGLASFAAEHPHAKTFCVGEMDRAYRIGSTLCLPWREFFGLIEA